MKTSGRYRVPAGKEFEEFRPKKFKAFTPRSPGQRTLESLRGWNLSRNPIATNMQTTRNPVSVHEGGSSSLLGQFKGRAVDYFFPPIPPSKEAPTPHVQKTPVPWLQTSTLHLSASVKGSSMFRFEDAVTSEQSQAKDRFSENRVIGVLPGTNLYMIQLEHLLGAFSPWNMLDLIPGLKAEIGFPTDWNQSQHELSTEWVKKLMNHFALLNHEAYSYENISRMFTLHRDMNEEAEDKV